MEELFKPSGYLHSPLHRLDARVKVVALAGFIALVSTLTSQVLLALAVAFLILLTGVARLSPVCIVRRLLWVLPFAGVMVAVFPFTYPGETLWQWNIGGITLVTTWEGLEHAVILSLRVFAAVLALNLLSATTGMRGLMNALLELRLPPVFVQLLEFTVRYIFVLVDELQRMYLARKARAFRSGKSLFHRHTFQALGNLLGVLFMRSWERSERIYYAMLARGLGNIRSGPVLCWPESRDLGWGFCILAFAFGLRLMEIGGKLWQILLR